jgi:hypothetical protein
MTPDYPKPIAPPPEVTGEWWIAWDALDESERPPLEDFIATRAAKWGADQELEACIDWISVWHGLEHPELLIELLRAARRPEPPSLKEQALDAHNRMMAGEETQDDWAIVRRALEQLDD